MIGAAVQRGNRLRRGREFDQVFTEGTVVRGPFLVLRARPNDVGHPRWGVAAGKRLWKRAVDRNRLRRRLREAARSLDARGAVDVVVVARRGAMEQPFAELQAELRRLARRAGLEVD